MLIFLCVVVGLMWVSYVRARDRGLPWFSLGGSKRLRTQEPVPRFSSGRPNYQSRAKRRSGQSGPALDSRKRRAKPAEVFPAGAFHRLTGLTRNVETSDRLVRQISAVNPDKDMLWCVQKAIYDIERDRMS